MYRLHARFVRIWIGSGYVGVLKISCFPLRHARIVNICKESVARPQIEVN